MTTASETRAPGGFRVGVQKFGSFLSGMVMPNIPAFIAWGLITSFFIQPGWTPVPVLGGFPSADGTENVGLVGPMITYLLPLLIANQGGRLAYSANPTRGGVVGTIATMGVILGAGIPMFIGAMIVGPLGGWLTKQMDKLWFGKIRPGFEMLVDNFSGGILGGALAIGSFFGIAPVVTAITNGLSGALQALVNWGILPLVSLIVEPAKVLFLNNALNHGIFTPLAAQQVEETGKSIYYLIETNPGPGLGVLLAFAIFGVGISKASAPGAIIIHFFGGIHEIYFPYVLMKPQLIVSVIAGGFTGVLVNVIFDNGLVGPAAPGSIIAILTMAAPGKHLTIIVAVLAAAAVSFLISWFFLALSRKSDLAAAEAGEDKLAAAVAQTQANKGKESSVLGTLGGTAVITKPLTNIVFACDAGMGSSAMGASVLRKKFKDAGVTDVTVVNKAIANLSGDEDLVITQQQLTDRAKTKSPDAIHVSVNNFMGAPEYDEVVEQVKASHEA